MGKDNIIFKKLKEFAENKRLIDMVFTGQHAISLSEKTRYKGKDLQSLIDNKLIQDLSKYIYNHFKDDINKDINKDIGIN